MKQVYEYLPVYTGDVSGVCSVLFELGGMIVIHDPSGCNSTYNTHDETRWYDQDSLIFISGLTEKQAMLGDDEPFIQEVIEAAKNFQPSFICLVNSPIPYVNGTDFNSITKTIEKETGIYTFHLPTNAMHDYTYGASLGYDALLPFMEEGEKNEKVNILGATPLDINKKTLESIKSMYDINSLLTYDCRLEDVKKAPRACKNIVISSTGLSLAKKMKEKYDIPYETTFPIQVCIHTNRSNKKVLLIGESILMNSISTDLKIRYGVDTKVLTPLEKHIDVETIKDEEDIKEEMKNYDIIIGDPMYQVLTDKPFVSVPHYAFSGRLYQDRLDLGKPIVLRSEWL